MKFLRLTLLTVMAGGLLMISSCGGDPPAEAPIEKTQLNLLSKTWELTAATYGNTTGNRTTDYQNMELTISGVFNATPGTSYDFTVTGLPTGPGVKTPWPGSGTWKFDADDPSFLIIRSDDMPITYTVTASKLSLSFNYEGTGFRTSAVEGQWKFEFEPK